jgi:hypothetical protein
MFPHPYLASAFGFRDHKCINRGMKTIMHGVASAKRPAAVNWTVANMIWLI